MRKILYSGLLVFTLIFTVPFQTTAATLGLSTQDPSLDSSFAFVDYFEFSTSGDLSSFGGVIDSSSGISPFGFTEFSFGVGFTLSDPLNTAAGGFDVFDGNGLFLSGDLLAVGYTENIIEFQFDQLAGSAASNFGSSVLMLINFVDQLGSNPFNGLVDGTFYDASVNIASVVPITEPQIFTIFALALILMGVVRSRS